MKALSAFAAGILFGLGLTLSGMSDPLKVLGFLDVVGRLDTGPRIRHGRRPVGVGGRHTLGAQTDGAALHIPISLAHDSHHR